MSVYSTAILAEPALVNYWQLNDASGTTAVDSKGSLPLTYSGGFTLNQAGPAGVADVAVAFNGSTGKAEATPAGTISGTFSVECWLKTSSGSFLGAMLGTRNGGNYCEFRVNAGTLDALIGTGSAFLTTAAGPSPAYSNGAWHHVVFLVSDINVRIYFDGAFVDIKQYGSATPKLWDTSTKIDIGFAGTSTEWWNGSLCQVAVYNALLSSLSIANHFRLGSGSPIVASNIYVSQPGSILVASEKRRSWLGYAPINGNPPTDRLSGVPGTYFVRTAGDVPATLIGSPWGNALSFGSTTEAIRFGGNVVPGTGPWTAFCVANLGIASSGVFPLVSNNATFAAAGSGLTMIVNTAAYFLAAVKVGTGITVTSILKAIPGDWCLYAIVLDRTFKVTFYIYDYDTGSLSIDSSQSNTTAVLPNASTFFTMAGGPSTDNFTGSIVAAGIDGRIWNISDFIKFAADPFDPIRPPSRPAIKFASIVPPSAGTSAATETHDTLAGSGGLTVSGHTGDTISGSVLGGADILAASGSMASLGDIHATERRDTFTASGSLNAFAGIHPTERPDTLVALSLDASSRLTASERPDTLAAVSAGTTSGGVLVLHERPDTLLAMATAGPSGANSAGILILQERPDILAAVSLSTYAGLHVTERPDTLVATSLSSFATIGGGSIGGLRERPDIMRIMAHAVTGAGPTFPPSRRPKKNCRWFPGLNRFKAELDPDSRRTKT